MSCLLLFALTWLNWPPFPAGLTQQGPTPLINKAIHFRLQNNGLLPRSVILKFQAPGAKVYAVEQVRILPLGMVKKAYPAGTTVELMTEEQQSILMTGKSASGRLICTLRESDNGKTFPLFCNQTK